MRWYEHETGETKIKRKFALFPIKIGKETRWLEWVTIQYGFYNNSQYYDPNIHITYRCYGWMVEKFVDNKTIEKRKEIK